MNQYRCGHQTDEEILADVEFPAAHCDKEYKKQKAERKAFLSDPANAELIIQTRERMQVAKALYDARHQAKLTQAEVAEKMKVSRPVVARLERGRGNLTLDMISRYARACGKKVAVTLL